MITSIRLVSQQLINPVFDNPKDLVAWMGAIQAQDYTMCKWAVGMRLKSATIHAVDEALRKGEILRTHVMRPTWHLVPAEDIRWMLKLSAQRIQSANKSYGKSLELSDEIFMKCNRLFEKILQGNKNMTKQEIALELDKEGVLSDPNRLNVFITHAETEGIICSGVDKGGKPTYALLEERVPPAKELTKDEALATLARRYFRSHSPASLRDFIWWSGLSVTEAKQAISLLGSELITDRYASHDLFVHESYALGAGKKNIVHFLPSYDEYLISYKERTTVMDLEHHPKAFTNYGIFYPVILHNGKVIGNWNKTARKDGFAFKTSFFHEDFVLDEKKIKVAAGRYNSFMFPAKRK